MSVEDARKEIAGLSAWGQVCGVKRSHAWRDKAERKEAGVFARLATIVSDTLTTDKGQATYSATARLPI